jgi:Na+/proline symporter
MLITGLTVLGLVFFMGDLRAMGPNVDFEQILPFVLKNYIPTGLLGLLIAGLLAAFMSNFAATVNAAPAYVVNDIYKRYINPNAEPKKYVHLSYIVSLVFVILGVSLGFFVPSINNVLQWLVSGLFGGYTAANVLKWYWWRFNDYGYFWGMLVGIVSALALSQTSINALQAFPYLLGLCLAVCVISTFLTPATDMEVLKKFYLKVRPWGYWEPVRKAIEKEYPNIQPNKNFKRDMCNVAIGIIWQTSLVAAPIFLVIKQWTEFGIAMAIVACCVYILWKNWYNKLEDYPADVPDKLLIGTHDEHLLRKTP